MMVIIHRGEVGSYDQIRERFERAISTPFVLVVGEEGAFRTKGVALLQMIPLEVSSPAFIVDAA